MKLTQRQRVKRALDQRGPRGVSPVDFTSPTIDGGPPIMRVAARIYELRQTYKITEITGDDGCARYLYSKYLAPPGTVGDPDAHSPIPPGHDAPPGFASPSGSPSVPASLFDAPVSPSRSAIYDAEAA